MGACDASATNCWAPWPSTTRDSTRASVACATRRRTRMSRADRRSHAARNRVAQRRDGRTDRTPACLRSGDRGYRRTRQRARRRVPRTGRRPSGSRNGSRRRAGPAGGPHRIVPKAACGSTRKSPRIRCFRCTAQAPGGLVRKRPFIKRELLPITRSPLPAAADPGRSIAVIRNGTWPAAHDLTTLCSNGDRPPDLLS